ncbi:hypothetical protein ACFL6I_24540 [candidate division KSB1 bacterium]
MRHQKGKILSWIIFIVLILIFFAALLYFQKIKKEPTAESVPVTTPTKERVIEEAKPVKPRKQFAVPEVAEEEKERRDNEALNKALLSGEGCEDIEYDEALRQLCLDTLLYDSAIQKTDETACEQISDPELRTKCHDQIYFSLATKGLDAELCNKIESAELKKKCSDTIQALSGRTAESAESCGSIADAVLKQNCLDNFYFTNSIENLTEESCENIADPSLKDRCSKTVAKNKEVIEISKQMVASEYQSNEEKLQNCEQLSDESAQTCRDETNYNLALEKKDLSYCSKIQNKEKQDLCVKVQTANINNYYLKQATSRKDPSLCNKILDEGMKATCLTYAQ